jgi:hypothetical protein
MNKPTVEQVVEAVRQMEWTGKGFSGDKKLFVTWARYDGLRSKKSRQILKRVKQLAQKAIMLGMEMRNAN